MSSVEDTLKKRNARYGSFAKNADGAQNLKGVFLYYHQGRMAPIMIEALDLIATKLSRILTGDPSHADNWHDIAGYATLVEKWLQNKKPL